MLFQFALVRIARTTQVRTTLILFPTILPKSPVIPIIPRIARTSLPSLTLRKSFFGTQSTLLKLVIVVTYAIEFSTVGTILIPTTKFLTPPYAYYRL